MNIEINHLTFTIYLEEELQLIIQQIESSWSEVDTTSKYERVPKNKPTTVLSQSTQNDVERKVAHHGGARTCTINCPKRAPACHSCTLFLLPYLFLIPDIPYLLTTCIGCLRHCLVMGIAPKNYYVSGFLHFIAKAGWWGSVLVCMWESWPEWGNGCW